MVDECTPTKWRRRYHGSLPSVNAFFALPPPASSAIEELEGFVFDFRVNEDAYKVEGDPSPRKRYVSSADPLKEWLPLRDEYLQELLAAEGLLSSCCEAYSLLIVSSIGTSWFPSSHDRQMEWQMLSPQLLERSGAAYSARTFP
ncbi:hypothetical protein ONZ45_g16757 [Pleurotus djamor]|nr:hypothetical protein ONZ45_g16757 [Pleurotus djamor]